MFELVVKFSNGNMYPVLTRGAKSAIFPATEKINVSQRGGEGGKGGALRSPYRFSLLTVLRQTRSQ